MKFVKGCEHVNIRVIKILSLRVGEKTRVLQNVPMLHMQVVGPNPSIFKNFEAILLQL